MVELAVIGGGPAGLRVAELCAEAGVKVQVFDQKRSVGRKFLVAGKSGLNLTNDADREAFLSSYNAGEGFPRDLWAEIYDNFDNAALRQWAFDLGQQTFVSSGKKVFPQSMKAAPLLRAWVKKIKDLGGVFHPSHCLTHLTRLGDGYQLTFSTEDQPITVMARRVVIATGGASWPQTGSDGKWVDILQEQGIDITPLQPANCGWEYQWSDHLLAVHEGSPWKNIVCTVGIQSVKGELVITNYGLEGGPIYRLGHALRSQEKPCLEIDFKPDFSRADLIKKAESVRTNLLLELPRRWKVTPSAIMLLSDIFPTIFKQPRATLDDIITLAAALKKCHLQLTRPRTIHEAISSAGGVPWNVLDKSLQIKSLPGVYACGEMLDWEAPTGGFLIQGCMSTAAWVSQAVLSQR